MALPGQPAGISQTSFIFATVFVAYLVFITLRGDLAKWLGVFGFGAYTAPPASTGTDTGSSGATTTSMLGGAGTGATGDASGVGSFGQSLVASLSPHDTRYINSSPFEQANYSYFNSGGGGIPSGAGGGGTFVG